MAQMIRSHPTGRVEPCLDLGPDLAGYAGGPIQVPYRLAIGSGMPVCLHRDSVWR